MSILLRNVLRLGILSAAFLAQIASGSPVLSSRFEDSSNPPDAPKVQPDGVLLKVHLLDSRGLPLANSAEVRLFSVTRKLDVTAGTQQSSSAEFQNVQPGDYELEITSAGFSKTTQHLHVVKRSDALSVFVYLPTESEAVPDGPGRHSRPLKSDLQNEINRGADLLQKKQFEKAGNQFSKAVRTVRENPDLWCLLGMAELGQQHNDEARQDLDRSLALNPVHEGALLGLAELDLKSGQPSAALDLAGKAYRYHGAGWRTHFLLASAYAQSDRLPEAESHARRAVTFAERNAAPDAAPALMLLADILSREGKPIEAKQTWQRVSDRFPSSPEAKEAVDHFQKISGESPAPDAPPPVEGLTLDALPEIGTQFVRSQPARPVREQESPWAPGDVDAREYLTADGVACKTDEVLDLAQDRLNTQLLNFERFTATEHVVHQEIESSGAPDPALEKDFSYIVFVYPYSGNSLYLEESRDGGANYSAFPTAMVTTGINSLGVALLQPANRGGFTYQCEGLTSIRGQAAWQIRFEEKPDTTASIRRWRTNKASYNLRVKGRLWITSTSFDILRIQTDLLAPVRDLGLTRDHLEVDYGPVSFQSGNQRLWLPWNANMYMEFRHKRFHHQHFLTDYMLFGVDETQKVGSPKDSPAQTATN